MEVVYPQLWIFDFDRSSWTCVEAAGGPGAAGGAAAGAAKPKGGGGAAAGGPGPPSVFDHTATLAGGKHIVVIGGVMVGKALNSEVTDGSDSSTYIRISVFFVCFAPSRQVLSLPLHAPFPSRLASSVLPRTTRIPFPTKK